MAVTSQEIKQSLGIIDELTIKVAKLAVKGVAENEIARVCGLTQEQLQRLQVTPAYKTEFQRWAGEALEKADLLNRGWDAIEEEGMGRILETLQGNPDPEFALRAATAANKAVRRGGFGQKPLNGTANAAAVISLPQIFIDKLQMVTMSPTQFVERAKRVDRLSPAAVEKMLGDDVRVDDLPPFNMSEKEGED